MQTFIPTREALQEAVLEAVEQAVEKKLPEIIHKATRKKYYTIQEVCDLLKISRRHLLYLRNSHQIGFIKSGRKIYFRVEDLEEFFDENYIDAIESSD